MDIPAVLADRARGLDGSSVWFSATFFLSLDRTTINYYLVNLSVADLLISAWCPWTSLTHQVLAPTSHYILPPIFCKLDVFYRVLCIVASVLTLSAISFDR